MSKILIVGGGPIGLLTALELAEDGHIIDLVEAYEWPRDKVCGEGLMPIAKDILNHHQIDFSKSNSSFFYGIRYISIGQSIKGLFENNFGVAVRRTELSKRIFEKASSHKNIRLHPRTRLKRLVSNQNNAEASFESDTFLEWAGDYVVGSDGAQSKVRKEMNIGVVSLSSHQRLGGRVHFNVPDHGIDEVQVYWSRGAEAYLTPCGKDQIEIAFMWERSLFKGSAKEIEEHLWEIFPELKKRYKSLKDINDTFSYVGGFATKSEKIVKNRVVLIGDAAYFFDGITGKGISMGFEMARWLRLSLKDGNFDLYQYQAKKIINSNIRLTKFVLCLSHFPLIRKVAFKFLTNKLFNMILNNLNQSNIPLTSTIRM